MVMTVTKRTTTGAIAAPVGRPASAALLLAAGLLAAVGLPPHAMAQYATPTQAIDVPPGERLFGDWDDPQSYLGSRGINIQISALTEFASNVSGGVKQGATFS